MLKILAILTAAWVLSGSAARAEEPLKWCVFSDVEHLANALFVAEFPMTQGELRSVLGMHDFHPVWGSTDTPGTEFWIFALTDPRAGAGYYAARVTFSDKTDGVQPDDIPVLSVQLVFVAPGHLTFALELNRAAAASD